MRTFFSILSINIDTNLNDKISIGLVMSDGEKSYFKASFSKLNAVKGILPPQKFSFIKGYLRDIQNSVKEIEDHQELYLKDKFSEQWIAPQYFNYLNRYSNNLIKFTEARFIDVELDTEKFNDLFVKFIFCEPEPIQAPKHGIVEKVVENLYPKIKSHVDINFTASSLEFSELITPVDIDFIGKNGVVVAGQTIDFSKRAYNLENDLTRFISFSKAVDYQEKDNDKGKYFVVGKEPSKNIPENHKTWQNIKNSHLVDYVDISDLGRIEEYMEQRSVKPWTSQI